MNLDINNLKGKRVAVIGDLMLDTYHVGSVKRISPEAPVPVVRVARSYSVLGGAANVARNLLGLGVVPSVVGTIGNDSDGAKVLQMFEDLGVEIHSEYTAYQTTTKTRIIGNDQQVVRIDFEDEKPKLSKENEQNLIKAIESLIPNVDVVILSDYDKGVCNPQICQAAILSANRYNKLVVVDPKGTDWDKYRYASIITPNIKELSDIVGCEVKNEDKSVVKAAEEIAKKYNLNSLLVTRSEKGMSYVNLERYENISTEAREVFDVSGAGDTVVATLAASLAAKFPVSDSIRLANKAAGIVVAKMGTAPVLFNELEAALLINNSNSKIVEADNLQYLLHVLTLQRRSRKKKVVFTNGCFDILHRGHVTYLEEAKKRGDILVLGLNSDASVRRLKGESRPINDQVARSTVMAALSSVDYVVVFEEDTPLNLIEAIRPDILVKGGDYAIENIVGREFAKETITIPIVEGYSTTKIVNKI